MSIDETKVVDPKVAELEEQLKELEAQNKNLKATLSERNSENASKKREIEEWKEKYNSTLTEAQLAEQKRLEAEAEKDAKFNELLRKSQISDYKAMYLSLGYDEELAQSSAEAKADNNDEILFANMKTYMENKEKEIKAEMLKGQPSITQGSPLTTEQAEKESTAKLYKYFGL